MSTASDSTQNRARTIAKVYDMRVMNIKVGMQGRMIGHPEASNQKPAGMNKSRVQELAGQKEWWVVLTNCHGSRL
jgi:hypothetical protein